MGNIKYEIMDGFDYVIDESGNQILALRKIRWGEKETVHLDLRRWFLNPEGEVVGKGTSFMTEEGPHELVNVLTKEGYGHTIDIINNIKDREDFQKSINIALGKESEFFDESLSAEEEYYDPKSSLLE